MLQELEKLRDTVVISSTKIIDDTFNLVQTELLKQKRNVSTAIECIRLCTIHALEHEGLTYNPNITEIVQDNRKFFCFKVSDAETISDKEILSLSKGIIEGFLDKLRMVDIHPRNYEFSIIKMERLSDKDSFSELVRGMITWRRIDE